MRVMILMLALVSSMLLIGALIFGFMTLGGKVALQNHLEIAILAVGISVITHILCVLYILRER